MGACTGLTNSRIQKIIMPLQKIGKRQFQNELLTFSTRTQQINICWFLNHFYTSEAQADSFRNFQLWMIYGVNEDEKIKINQEIKEIIGSQNTGQAIIEKIFEGNKKFSELIEMFGNYKNPSIYPYLNYCLYNINKAIKDNFFSQKPNQQKLTQFFVVVKLSQKDIQKLVEAEDRDMTYSERFLLKGFKKGYLDEKQAKSQKKKDKQNFIFKIRILKEYFQWYKNKNYDQGYFIHKRNIILNFQNVFKFDLISIDDKQVSASFGVFSEMLEKRVHFFRSTEGKIQKGKRVSERYAQMVYDSWDFINIQKIYLKSQADLFYAFDMYEEYNNFITEIRATRGISSSIQETTNLASTQAIQSSNSILQKFGDMEAKRGNKSEAKSFYKKITFQFKAEVKMFYAEYFLWKTKTTDVELKEIVVNSDQKNYFTKATYQLFQGAFLLQKGKLKEAEIKIVNAKQKIKLLFQNSYQIDDFNKKNQKDKLKYFYDQSIESFPLYYLLNKINLELLQARGKQLETDSVESIQRFQRASKGINYIWLPLGF